MTREVMPPRPVVDSLGDLEKEHQVVGPQIQLAFRSTEVEAHVLGKLSFGTRERPRFSGDDVVLMRTVADEVAVAMERIQSQRALHEANARLQDADRRKDEFLAVLSHELRNPLAPIHNSLYLLDRAAPGGEQARRSLDVIRRQATHLTRLVDDLLDVTRVSRARLFSGCTT